MTIDLEQFSGQRIEVELEGKRFRGRVVRGPARKAVLLEELGEVGEKRSDAHMRLQMMRTWTASRLAGAELVRRLPLKEEVAKPKRCRASEWSETVAIAEADPAVPPPDFAGGLLAWAELVHASRRKVERSRKAMLQALREAAG